jgi:hypothetical protein
MRNSAPAVIVELAPNRLHVVLALLLPSGALVALATWVWVQLSPQHGGMEQVGALASTAAALAAMTLLAARNLLAQARQPGRLRAARGAPIWQASHLHWDGLAWALTRNTDGSRQPCSVAVRLDAGTWLLLQLRALPVQAGDRPEHWTCWLALSQHQLPADWHALRCALYSSRPPPDRINDR